MPATTSNMAASGEAGSTLHVIVSSESVTVKVSNCCRGTVSSSTIDWNVPGRPSTTGSWKRRLNLARYTISVLTINRTTLMF